MISFQVSHTIYLDETKEIKRREIFVHIMFTTQISYCEELKHFKSAITNFQETLNQNIFFYKQALAAIGDSNDAIENAV